MILRVDFDPMAFVRVLETAKAKLGAVRFAQDASAPQVVQAARDFAAAIFGGEQAGRLLDFYGGHGAPVISICSRYLRGRLAKRLSARRGQNDEAIRKAR